MTFCATPGTTSGWGKRHTVAALGFWAFAISYAMRVNLSIAIVAMVNNTKPVVLQLDSRTQGNLSISMSTEWYEEACIHLKEPPMSQVEIDSINNTLDSQGEFRWDSIEQGLILGSFFWGYVISQIPGGILATKYGGKWTLGAGVLVAAIFQIFTPLLARTHMYLLIAARMIQGMGDGVITPAMHALVAAWAPPDERSWFVGIVYSGSQLGIAMAMVISGYLIDGGILGGWPSVFYIIGGFSILWFILWVLLIYDSPDTHPSISQDEFKYIQNTIGTDNKGTGGHGTAGSTPWLEIATSLPMLAIVAGHTGHTFGYITLLTLLPTYLNTVLHFDLKQNSWMSALPFVVMLVVALAMTQLADYLIVKKILKTITLRKFCQTIAHIGSALALVLSTFVGCDRVLTVLLLTIAVGMNGIVVGGFLANHVDISPNYAGILLGITNTVSTLIGFASPYIAGQLINVDPSLQNWQYVFFVVAGIYFVDVIIYVLFASCEEQPWNQPKSPRSRRKKSLD